MTARPSSVSTTTGRSPPEKLTHPAVTSVLIGPRTPGQLADLLAGAGATLDDEILDRIDEIVPPGTDLNPADRRHLPPALADKALRRRARRD